MDEPQDLSTYVGPTIPKALSDLMEAHNNIDQIAAYCKNAYSAPGADQAKVCPYFLSLHNELILSFYCFILN